MVSQLRKNNQNFKQSIEKKKNICTTFADRETVTNNSNGFASRVLAFCTLRCPFLRCCIFAFFLRFLRFCAFAFLRCIQ